MKKEITLSFIIPLSIISLHCLAQPYGGTIFIEPDIIIVSDSSTLESVTYTGQGDKTVFDRRVNGWITIYAYLFDVVWNDGLSSEAVINPEFESIDLARAEAEKYGRHIGQLPTCLRTDVNEIWIHKGVELFGGGNNSILIHTGQSVNYENAGILEETLVHEASHTSLDAMHAESPGWLEAQDLDGEFISDYAEEFPDREDIAESFLLWIAVRYREDRISVENFNIISQTIPNRLNYFDEISCDMFPIIVPPPTVVHDVYQEAFRNIAYPNPATDFISLDLDNDASYRADIYNSAGVLVFSEQLRSNQNISISSLPKGLYILRLHSEGTFIREKFIKW